MVMPLVYPTNPMPTNGKQEGNYPPRAVFDPCESHTIAMQPTHTIECSPNISLNDSRKPMEVTRRTLACLALTILLSPLGIAQNTTGVTKERKLEKATFGGGCFWCTEAVFQRVKGVEKVVSGYTGGKIKNPTYEQVCTGTTGHAEVIQVEFDPKVVSFAKLLEIHWKTHDPTTLNRQGYDEGTQYRSAIFYENEEQKKVAQEYKDKLNKEVFDGKIVTEITALDVFYPAEDYHQNYYNLNKTKGYCRAVIVPKLQKFEEVFSEAKK